MPQWLTLKLAMIIITALVSLGTLGYIVHEIRQGVRDDIALDTLKDDTKVRKLQNEDSNNRPDSRAAMSRILRVHGKF